MTANTTLELIFDQVSAKIEWMPETNTLIVSTKKTFINRADFEELFSAVENCAKTRSISKLIFDKSSLRVFDQPSMVWYHIEWKPKMLAYGLKAYRKILPQDTIFRTSVKIGKERILRDYPSWDPKRFDIQYFDSVEEALEK